jgi:hypothetical protein
MYVATRSSADHLSEGFRWNFPFPQVYTLPLPISNDYSFTLGVYITSQRNAFLLLHQYTRVEK